MDDLIHTATPHWAVQLCVLGSAPFPIAWLLPLVTSCLPFKGGKRLIISPILGSLRSKEVKYELSPP